jgi:hypothetical protein
MTSSLALQVVANPALFSLTCSFQHGVPLWVVDYECMFSHADEPLARNDQAKQSMDVKGLLPRLAIQNHDLDTLERLLELSAQEYCQAHPKFSFDSAIDDAAKGGDLEVLQWLRDIAGATYQHGSVCTAAQNGHDNAVLWLLANFPECHGEITAALMDTAARNGDLGIVHVLHEWSTEGCTTQAMDGAAANGHLDVVVFLHEHRMEGCTTAAVDDAARNGHLHVIEWLLLLRDEGFTEDAGFEAIMNGHVEVLQCLWENRGRNEDALRSGICKAVPLTLSTMGLAMVVLLNETVPEAFPIDAIAFAASSECRDVAKYLRAVGGFHEGADALLLSAAASQDHAEAQSLLDHEAFSMEVLREALDKSTKANTDRVSDDGSCAQDAEMSALQIRLRLLIESQATIISESGSIVFPAFGDGA